MNNPSLLAVVLISCSALAAQANCPPPMQILFACTLEENQARVEFCHEILHEQTSTSSSVSGDMQTYSYVHGTEPAELFFVPTTSYFNSFPTSDVDRKIYGNGARAFLMTGYENRDHVYAALLAVGEELYSGFHGAEVRVFRNAEDMEKAQQGSEVARYFCEEGSVIADQYEFRP